MSTRSLSAQDDAPEGIAAARELDLERIRRAVQGIRFGEVRLIVQDGLIVQIERVEKERLR
jgi:hypothetical protein